MASDAELLALAAIVSHEAAVIAYETQRFGEVRCNPNSPSVQALYRALDARGVYDAPTVEVSSDGE